MKLKHFEQYLQNLDDFQNPNLRYEQYSTPVHLVSHILYTIQSQFDDVEGKLVADLGIGCGHLSIGASLLGAKHVTGFEIDSNALKICQSNLDYFELTNVDLIQCNIQEFLTSSFEKKFDTVIMNPPFGTKNNAGIDMNFLKIASKLSINAVYSLHKTSTRSHVLKEAEKLGMTAKVLAELKYDIKKCFKFHKKQSVDIFVDFIRFQVM